MAFKHDEPDLFASVGTTYDEFDSFRRNFIETVNTAGEAADHTASKQIEAGVNFIDQQGENKLVLATLLLIDAYRGYGKRKGDDFPDNGSN